MKNAFDVIVLGVGGMGSAASFEMARRGLRVLGLEQFSLVHARGSSHGHTRIIRTAYAEHPGYVPLVRRAFTRWYELEQFTGRHLLTACPCLNIGSPSSEHIEGVRASVREHALSAHEMSGDLITERYPAFRVPHQFLGILENEAGFLYVESCVQSHIDAAVSLGAEIHNEESVKEWKILGDGVEVVTDRGTYRAAKLIITAGAWATQLLAGIGVPLAVMRQTLLWFDIGDRVTEFHRGRFPIFIADVPGGPFYGLPAIDRNGLKVAGHYGAPELPNPDGVNWDITDRDVTAMRTLLDEYIPGLGPLTKGNVCMYTVTPDRHFVIDMHPMHPQVIVACGFSGHGFKFASAVGEVLADLVQENRTPHAIEMFSIKRFKK